MLERIYLKDIGPRINKKTPDTIKRWCKDSNVIIYKDSSGEFVFKNDFDIAYNMPLILQLRRNHGENWSKVYNAYIKGELHNLITFKEDINKYQSGYKPKGSVGKKLI